MLRGGNNAQFGGPRLDERHKEDEKLSHVRRQLLRSETVQEPILP